MSSSASSSTTSSNIKKESSSVALSVRVILAVAALIFIILVITVGLIFFFLANDALERSGFEIGHGELHATQEIFNSRLISLKHKMDSTATNCHSSSLWRDNPTKYNSSNPTGIYAWFNDTLATDWATDIWESPGWTIGYALQAYIPPPNDGSQGRNYRQANPQIYYDRTAAGDRDYVNCWKREETTVTTCHNFEVTNRTSTTRILSSDIDLEVPVFEKQVKLTDFAYNFTPTASARPFRNTVGLEGRWDPTELFVLEEGYAYHYFTYISPGIKLAQENSSSSSDTNANQNATSINFVGWIAVNDIFDNMEMEAVGKILVIDTRGRILTTNRADLNIALQRQIAAPQPDYFSELNSTLPTELGTNFPDTPNGEGSNVRRVFDKIYPELDPSAGRGPVTKQIRADDGQVFFVEMRTLQADIGLSIVWVASRDRILGTLRRQQILLGVLSTIIACAIAIVLVLIGYRSVGAPLRHLSKSMAALSNLDMYEVEKLSKEEEGGESYHVTEVQVLYSSYASVKETMAICLPYIPQTDGDLRIARMPSWNEEDEDEEGEGGMNGIFSLDKKSGDLEEDDEDELSSIGSAGETGDDSLNVSRGATSIRIGKRSLKRSGRGGGAGGKGGRLFDMLEKSGAKGILGNQNSGGDWMGTSAQSGGMMSGCLGEHSGRSNAADNTTTSPDNRPLPSPPSKPLQQQQSGSITSRGSVGVNKQLEMKNCVIAHFRLRPDLQYEIQGTDLAITSQESVLFSKTSYQLHYQATKIAAAYKGSVFSFGTTEVFCCWAGSHQMEKKAIEAATEIVESLMHKCVPLLAKRRDLRVPIVTVGVTQGRCLAGTTGTMLKRTYICEGPAVQNAAILSSVGSRICTHILADQKVRDGAAMFAELRPVEKIKLPYFTTAIEVSPSKTFTAWECIGVKGTTQLGVNLKHDVSEARDGGGGSGQHPLRSKKDDNEEDMEWMYKLQQQEQEEAARLKLATTAFEALTSSDLPSYRRALIDWAREGGQNTYDLFLTLRISQYVGAGGGGGVGVPRPPSTPGFDLSVNSVAEDTPSRLATEVPTPAGQQAGGTTILPVVGAAETTAAEPSPSKNGAKTEVDNFFEALRASGKEYCREASVLGCTQFPFE